MQPLFLTLTSLWTACRTPRCESTMFACSCDSFRLRHRSLSSETSQHSVPIEMLAKKLKCAFPVYLVRSVEELDLGPVP